jgi:hypothetical protein
LGSAGEVLNEKFSPGEKRKGREKGEGGREKGEI